MTARPKVVWRCQGCGASAPRWVGRCAECGEFGSFVEEHEPDASRRSGRPVVTEPVPLSEVGADSVTRFTCGIDELDDVLGGGLVPGSLVLLGGEPGIGKSTLLLQVAGGVAAAGGTVLYACGEESPEQIGMRARRLSASGERILLFPEIDMDAVEAAALAHRPTVLVLDSIQTAFDPELSGAPGSVGQVRACTARLMRIAKEHGVTTLIVGHVTKDGSIAGPRVLEHMVDTVLYFEGDRDHMFRVVRSVKNRFGAANGIGVFEMTETGLAEVESPSSVLLAERDGEVAGSTVFATMEGSRALLVEIQALVTPSQSPSPRRLATGIDNARLLQVLAILERHAGVNTASLDVVVSVPGGLRVSEPAVDLPLALAITSAVRGVSVPRDTVAFGEIGLTGHVRSVPHATARLREADRFGFRSVVCSVHSTIDAVGELQMMRVERVADAIPRGSDRYSRNLGSHDEEVACLPT